MASISIRIQDSDEPTELDARVTVDVDSDPQFPRPDETSFDQLTGAQQLALELLTYLTQVVPAAGGVVNVETKDA
jgi:hypothetical protein